MAETKDKASQDKKPVLPTKSNFSEWYNELLLMAEIMDVRYPVKGLMSGSRSGSMYENELMR